MTVHIGKEMAALERMTVTELRRKYAEVFGEATTSRHKDFLIRNGSPGGCRPTRRAACPTGQQRAGNWRQRTFAPPRPVQARRRAAIPPPRRSSWPTTPGCPCPGRC